MGEMHKKTMECFKLGKQSGYDYGDMVPEMGEWMDSRMNWDAIVVNILDYLPSVKSMAEITKVLDIGCGLGKLSRTLAKRLQGIEFYAVDTNPEYIKKAKLLAEEENIQNVSYSVHNAENLPEDWTRSIDWIIIYQVLHDLPNPTESMKEAKRVLKDNGIATIIDAKIHSHHSKNIGNVTVAGMGYAVSSFLCLPCSSVGNGAAKLGMGWGVEKKQTFLEQNDWVVKDKKPIRNNDFDYMFTCVKK